VEKEVEMEEVETVEAEKEVGMEVGKEEVTNSI